jgi:hypothetical protein
VGHYYPTKESVGKDRREAWSNLQHDFYYEHGHRCSIYSDYLGEYDDPPDPDEGKPDYDPEWSNRCFGVLVEKVPPMKQHVEEVEVPDWSPRGHGRKVKAQRISQVPDPDAPPERWLERWRFRFHYHA